MDRFLSRAQTSRRSHANSRSTLVITSRNGARRRQDGSSGRSGRAETRQHRSDREVGMLCRSYAKTNLAVAAVMITMAAGWECSTASALNDCPTQTAAATPPAVVGDGVASQKSAGQAVGALLRRLPVPHGGELWPRFRLVRARRPARRGGRQASSRDGQHAPAHSRSHPSGSVGNRGELRQSRRAVSRRELTASF